MAALALVGGCGEGIDSPADASSASLPGVYAGTYPCQNCPGIRVTLWLRPDGRFFIRHQYLGDADKVDTTTYNLGRWRAIADGRGIELRGAGPRRTYTRPEPGTLAMRVDSDLGHLLSRQSTAPEFSAVVPLTGMMGLTADRASFTECLTGFAAAVDESPQLNRFRRQYRSIDVRGEPVFVEFEGRFNWSKGGSLTSFAIERFASIRENRSC